MSPPRGLVLLGGLAGACGSWEEVRERRLDPDGDGVGLWEDCYDADPERAELRWLPDADGDGTGDPGGEAQVACTPIAGHAAEVRGLDCDDTNKDIHPGAEEECGDGEVWRCDGATGELDLRGAAADCPWGGEVALDEQSALWVAVDGGGAALVTTLGLALAAPEGWLAAAAAEGLVVCSPGAPGGLACEEPRVLETGLTQPRLRRFQGLPGWVLLAETGGDGVLWVLDAADWEGLAGGALTGVVEVSGTPEAEGAPAALLGPAIGAGDLDGDGAPDLLIGVQSGGVRVLWGEACEDPPCWPADVDDTSSTYKLKGLEELLEVEDGTALDLALGQLDGQGPAELVVALSVGSDTWVRAFELNAREPVLLAEFRLSAGGPGPLHLALDDADGDGRADLLVADAAAGVVCLAPGGDPPDWGNPRCAQRAGLGPAVAWGPDLGGDGLREALVGDPGQREVVVVHGEQLWGEGMASALDGIAVAAFQGPGDSAVGSSLVALPDLDGDGVGELALGDPGLGGVWLLRGGGW